MKEYERFLRQRSEKVGNLTPWYWINSDVGAWNGPARDWEGHIQLYRQYVKNWNVCIQAGGNQGLYPRLFAELFYRVYTFEPDPLNFICLVNNCQKDNIFKMQAALGSKLGGTEIVRNDMDNTGMHKIKENPDYAVPMLTIDSLNLDACDLIQLDIEGYELEALKGAKKTIKKYAPVISCENGDGSVAKFLENLGYKYVAKSGLDSIYVPK